MGQRNVLAAVFRLYLQCHACKIINILKITLKGKQRPSDIYKFIDVVNLDFLKIFFKLESCLEAPALPENTIFNSLWIVSLVSVSSPEKSEPTKQEIKHRFWEWDQKYKEFPFFNPKKFSAFRLWHNFMKEITGQLGKYLCRNSLWFSFTSPKNM